MTMPKIRFEGFNNKWESHSLGEIGTTYGGLTGKNKFDFGHGEAQYITYMNVFSNMVSDPSMVDYVEIDPSQQQVAVGDALFTTSSETPEEVGMSSVVTKLNGITYLNSFCFGYRPKIQFDLHFLASLLRSTPVRSEFQLLAQGISRFNISKKRAMDIPINVPSLEEQKTLGNYFRNLDELIKSEENKLKNLHNLKKSMLVKMFPQNGSNVPEIRFEGFDSVWSTGRLGDFIQSYSGGTPSAGDNRYYGGSIPFIRSAEVHATETALYLTEKGLSESSARLVNKGDILFALYGATAGEVDRAKISGAINQAILAIAPAPEIDSDFLVCWFSRWKNLILGKFLQGGQGNLSSKLVKDLEWQFPSTAEQDAIGNYFRNLDELIKLEEEKLNKLENLKNSFLDKMFV